MSWKSVEYENGKYRTNSGGGGSSHNYSTDEQEIGTWIDGKPLYEKTIDFGALPNATTKNVNHNISNADTIYIAEGFAYNPTNQYSLPLFLSASAGDWHFIIYKPEYIQCKTLSDRSAFTVCKIVLRYTKTTN